MPDRGEPYQGGGEVSSSDGCQPGFPHLREGACGRRTVIRLMVSAPASSSGKTAVTCALLTALRRRGLDPCAFKCGPDYIDPMFHKAVLGIPSRNLDLFFISEREVRGQIVRSIPQNGLGVIEGVMGFYDGVSGTTDTASAAHLARETGTPAILVVRPKGQSLSLAAMLSGFRNFAENTLCGVILNGISDTMYPFYRDIVQKSGLKVLGYLPSVPEARQTFGTRNRR